MKFYIAGNTRALDAARQYLQKAAYAISDTPSPSVTHLLLSVPSFEPSGQLKGGSTLAQILEQLPKNITVFGGNLHVPELEGYHTIDLLKDEHYLAENAAITAHCAVKILLNRLPVTLQDCPILVIGWGRIGKCLAQLLRDMGANVTVATRKEADRAILKAMNYAAVDTGRLDALSQYRVIFNTAPYPVINETQSAGCRPDCVKIDLASKLGIAGMDVTWARGLPGKETPETSGELIAKTVIRIVEERSNP